MFNINSAFLNNSETDKSKIDITSDYLQFSFNGSLIVITTPLEF